MFNRVLIVAAMALATTSTAYAGLTFDTITGQSTAGWSGSADGSMTMAASFTVSGTPNFNSISLLLSADDPTDGGSVMVYLSPDDGSGVGIGSPGFADYSNGLGTPIGSILDSSLAVTSDFAPSIVTLPGFQTDLAGMTPNNEYWITLIASPDSTVEWYYNTADSGLGAPGQASYSDANGYYLNDGGLGQGAFALIVDAPEPTTLAVLGGGLAGLGYIRRRRGQKA